MCYYLKNDSKYLYIWQKKIKLKMKYSWFNKTENEQYHLEDKELLNYQRMKGEECINVISENIPSKRIFKKRLKQIKGC